MFVDSKINPPGVLSEIGKGRKQLFKIFAGDTVNLEMDLYAACGAPATPDNSCVEIVLAENQFADPIWTGRWWKGARPDPNRAGLVRIEIPRDVTKALRRGSYMFSARVSDLTGYEFSTQEEGYFLVEYAPTSEQHSIPYRDGTSENFRPANGTGSGTSKEDEEYLVDEAGGKWQVGVTKVGALTTTPIKHVPTAAEYAAQAKKEAEKIYNNGK